MCVCVHLCRKNLQFHLNLFDEDVANSEDRDMGDEVKKDKRRADNDGEDEGGD